MKDRLIIGVTGTIRAGKDSVAHYLESKGFIHHSLSDILRDEASEQGLEQTRDTWVELGNKIREKYGIGELARRLLKKIEKNNQKLAVVSSIRNPGEIEAFREATNNFFLIGVDAPISMRYQRAQNMSNLADQVSFNEFKAQEEREMANFGIGQQLGVCLSMADFTIVNDSDLENLYKQINKFLNNI